MPEEKNFPPKRQPSARRAFDGQTAQARRGDKPGEPARKPRQSFADEISALDDELIRLLARRAKLLSRMRGGRHHAATPATIKSEKQIRAHWEARAGRISRDSLFIRQLFNLVQDISIHSEDGLDPDKAPLGLYNLSPQRKPVKVELPGPGLAEQAMLWLALAADLGWNLRLDGVQRTKGLMDFYRAFGQAGAGLQWSGPEAEADPASLWTDSLTCAPSLPLNPVNKTLFVGDDELVFYLLLFLGLDRPGKTRFTGARALKNTDLTPLYKMLPDLGARLAFAVPGSRGLPATLESSGALPALYVIPEDLPLPGVLALLLAAFTWRRPLALSLDRLPGHLAHNALSLLEPLFTAFPKAAAVRRSEVHYESWTGWGGWTAGETAPADVPVEIKMALDPVLAAYTLALPFFAGGEVVLAGAWPELPASPACIGLLRLAGLRVDLDGGKIGAYRGGNINREGALACRELPEELHPLFWAMNAFLAVQDKNGLSLPQAPEGADLELAADLLAQLGLELAPGQDGQPLRLIPAAPDESRQAAARTHGWNSPGPYWTLALSLGAFFRSNLKLSNPDGVINLFPGYWGLYNALPEPGRKAVKVLKAPRRRIVTQVTVTPPALSDEE
ncbi:MAG: chorismate mutase [Deltaproteobacteria bacterium]|jgi:chorismate mutase|nr:chorismate mutase [Deltaproteobacteria bacterium]